ncbi:hypothetical protein D779_3004 [Imhoffiella purpurea]|uniref:Uncharacterized protein n=2 Tax=Imhoffiella purpurea TaxID=1249627 RepID=W9VDC4_9GAMM|nr:hypothetical protein D779_3004 [Imhoffiella purpurea]
MQRESGTSETIVASMIERAHSAMMKEVKQEEQAKQNEPEPTPEERLERARRIRANIVEIADQVLFDAENEIAESASIEELDVQLTKAEMDRLRQAAGDVDPQQWASNAVRAQLAKISDQAIGQEQAA